MLAMHARRTYTVQLHLTPDEWSLVSRLAHLRGLTVEELLREGLRLSPPEGPPGEPERGRLLALRPRPAR
ncbi:MAG TPA: hypothetical protein VL979_08375 [Solirubrobacteraceae bacterium]|nr:hypothetical protein [Solirubrobacteraceae bacterium]